MKELVHEIAFHEDGHEAAQEAVHSAVEKCNLAAGTYGVENNNLNLLYIMLPSLLFDGS